MTRYYVPSCSPISCSVQMFESLRFEIVRASRSNRLRISALRAMFEGGS